MATEIPRDVIVRKFLINYEGATLQIFADLEPEIFSRRRLLKPLLGQMRLHNIQYSWGFPACLVGRKFGRSARQRKPFNICLGILAWYSMSPISFLCPLALLFSICPPKVCNPHEKAKLECGGEGHRNARWWQYIF